MYAPEEHAPVRRAKLTSIFTLAFMIDLPIGFIILVLNKISTNSIPIHKNSQIIPSLRRKVMTGPQK
jgi:hypothetical protein